MRLRCLPPYTQSIRDKEVTTMNDHHGKLNRKFIEMEERLRIMVLEMETLQSPKVKRSRISRR